jgi:hypothetical protein
MRATILTCAALLSTVGTSLHAQQSQSALIGSRVRVTVAADSSMPPRVVVGNLIAVGDSALVIRGGETAIEERVATSRIQQFERRTGKDRGAGARFGAVVGLVSGLVVGVALGDDCSREDFICFDRSETAAGGALIGLGLGAWIGLIAGRGDRWTPAAVPTTVSVTPSSGGGVRLSASFAF